MIKNNKQGEFIRKTRKKRGFSQKKLGDLIGSQSTISRIENNISNPNDLTILLLSQALSITPEEYFFAVFSKVEPDILILSRAISNAYLYQNHIEQNKLYHVTEKLVQGNPEILAYYHYHLMVISSINHLNHELISTDIQNELIDYFFFIEIWQTYDLYLLLQVAYGIKAKRMIPYITDILKQYTNGELPATIEPIIGDVILALLESSIMQNDLETSAFIFDKIKNINFQKQDMRFQTVLLFFEGVFEDDDQKIKDAYKICNLLQQDQLMKRFDLFLS